VSVPPPDRVLDATVVLARRPESCLLMCRGALVAIRRAPLDSAQLEDARRAFAIAAEASPRGVVMLTAFRLSPEFPLHAGFDTNVAELAETLRIVGRSVVANASVVEFGGVRGAAMRVATRTVWALARPRAAMAQFERLSDAIGWLLPHAAAIGAADDAATYARLYREADHALQQIDVARWVRGDVPGRAR
jgi:hypothetical protein